jgi:hypothetical protein
MKPIEIFRLLLSSVVEPSLKAHGFSRSGYTFYLRRSDNWGLVSFQKSDKSSPQELIFTINIGVASRRLLKFFQSANQSPKPDIWDTHWRERIGFLLSYQDDHWWSITHNTSLDNLGQELRSCILDLIVPEILSHIGDEDLCNMWLSGKSPSLTDFQRMQYLLVLLKALGPEEIFRQKSKEFVQIHVSKPTEIAARMHLEALQTVSNSA